MTCYTPNFDFSEHIALQDLLEFVMQGHGNFWSVTETLDFY